jgi:glyoxylase-like metal-dependent hydrolase (beta-lactamase superfamily II)
MKLSQHGRNLYKLSGFMPINIYLVKESDTLTVIDAGMSSSATPIIEAAQSIGLPITTISLTHAHGDHIGALDDLAARSPQAEVALHGRTAQFLQGNLDLLPGEPQAPLKGSFAQRTTQPTRLLQPGDQLGSLRIIAAPGHSPDQIAFHDERDGTLIVGDAYQTQGGTAVSGIIRWRFPLPAMATWHLPTALQTAVHLHGLNPTRLATGHGPVLDTPAAEMAKAIVQAEKKVATP